MSSNSAEPPAIASPRSSWSMTARFALLTAFSSFAILTVVSVQMYFQLTSHLKEQNARYLRDEIETLGQMARFPEFREKLAMETHVDPVGEEYLTHYVRLLEKQGEKITLTETPGMGNFLPQKIFPPPARDGKAHKAIAVRSDRGSAFIVTSLALGNGKNDGKQLTLQVGLDVTNVDKILAGYRYKLAGTLVVGFVLCSVTGLVIARRGTRPIREITEMARQITASKLDERLGGANWPREMNALAGALNGMLDRLQDSFSRLNGSVANLSHKLRTPLTILRGEAEVALGRERSAEELREIIESSLEEYERVSTLVDNIVFISQAEAGKLQHVLLKIKAREEIDKVLDFYAPLLEEKGMAVTCEGNATLAADPTLFRKMVAHLISNARTYSKPGGSIVITVRQGDDESAEVSVTDTGCGIAEEEMPKIFDRFYRVYDSRFMDPHGSGLGLPLVKTIMDLHRGTVEIKSRPGEGTTAVLKFPPSLHPVALV